MSRLEKIVLILLSMTLCFSENTGKAFLYSCCWLSIVERRQSLIFFGIISVLFDIYHSLFVGISFLSLAIVMAVVKKFESILLSLSVFVRIYYLFMIIGGAELCSCMFTVLLGGRLNFYSHLLIVMKSMLFCYVFQSLKEYAKRY